MERAATATVARARAMVGVAALALGLLYVVPAIAQWAVFDASNFAKNALTAAKSADAYAQQIEQYKLQGLQYLLQVQNLQAAPSTIFDTAFGREALQIAGPNANAAALAQAGVHLLSVYSSTQQLMNQGNSLYSQAADWGWTLQKFSAASGMTPQQIFSYEQSRGQALQGASQLQYQQGEQLQQDLQAYQQQADDGLRTAQNAQGAVQALEGIALQNHTLTEQLSDLSAAEATRDKAQAVHDAQEAQDKQEQAELYNEAQKRMQSYYDSAGVGNGIQISP